MRILCLDIGTVRIGVAVSDPLGMFAQGVAVWKVGNDWLTELGKTLDGYATKNLLLGLPIREDDTEGPAAQHIREVAAMIQSRYPSLKIRFWDERYSTRSAIDCMLEGDLSRKKRKQRVDKIAASVILESYMNSRGVENFN